jgi:hypothetical protein
MTLDSPQLEFTYPDGSNIISGTLMLSATSNRQINGGQQFAPRVIAAVYLTVDPSGTIIGCGPVMPTLPSPSPSPSPTPAPTPSPSIIAACVSAGGSYSNGVCSLPGHDNGNGNDGVNNGNGNDGVNNGKGN